MRPSIAGARPKGRSLFGCLSGCLTPILVIFTFGVIFGFVISAVFTPWAFYLGGRSFHIDLEWRGWGRMHSNISGDYALYIRLQPDMSDDMPSIPHTNLSGSAYICSPRGEIIRLDPYGTMRTHVNRITDGEAITLDMSHKPVFTAVFATDLGTDYRPILSFSGQWQNPNLVLTDSGSLSSAFQPDGTVYRGHDPRRRPQEIVALTLKPGSYADFKASCPAPRPDSR
jgi:hypothetical protein